MKNTTNSTNTEATEATEITEEKMPEFEMSFPNLDPDPVSEWELSFPKHEPLPTFEFSFDKLYADPKWVGCEETKPSTPSNNGDEIK